jgi:hypothetical protein
MKILFFLAFIVFVRGCQVSCTDTSASGPANAARTSASPSAVAVEPSGAFGKATPDTLAAECKKVKPDNNWVVIPEQTFAIDFEPFRGSCFVTSKNAEYEGSPVESEFAIYKGGKKAFDFPQQFNGTGFGCWVEAVAFQDLNKDGLTDIIVIAKCSGKDATYSESSVYANTGSGFVTDLDANYKLSEFKKISEVTDYVRSHEKLFFK